VKFHDGILIENFPKGDNAFSDIFEASGEVFMNNMFNGNFQCFINK
jgi:hypothetical protein